MSSIFLFTPKLLLDLQNMNSVLKSSIYKVSDRSTVQKAKQQCNSRSSKPERIFSVGVGNQIHRGLFFFFSLSILKTVKSRSRAVKHRRPLPGVCYVCSFCQSCTLSENHSNINRAQNLQCRDINIPQENALNISTALFFFLLVPFA